MCPDCLEEIRRQTAAHNRYVAWLAQQRLPVRPHGDIGAIGMPGTNVLCVHSDPVHGVNPFDGTRGGADGVRFVVRATGLFEEGWRDRDRAVRALRRKFRHALYDSSAGAGRVDYTFTIRGFDQATELDESLRKIAGLAVTMQIEWVADYKMECPYDS